MTETANRPCPFCGSTALVETIHFAERDQPFTGIPTIECADCYATAPVEVWNKRASPWRYPPDMPEEGQRVLMSYIIEAGHPGLPVPHIYIAEAECHMRPMVRWMAIPEEA